MPETTPLIKAALNLRVGAGFDVYVYSVVKRYPSLEEQLEYFSEYIYDFPKTLCVMSCILLYTGIDKENYFS